MDASRTLALLSLGLLLGCPGQDGGPVGERVFRSAAPPEAVKTGYLALVGACAAGNAEALWAQLTPRLQRELEATSGALRSLDADSLKRLYAHEAGAGPFDGKALLRGAVGAAAAAGELCKDAHRWEVLDKGFVGDGYLYAVGRSDPVVHGLLFAEASGGWKVDEIIRSRRADPAKQTVSAAPAADPAPEPDPEPQPPTLTRAQRIQRWLSAKLKGHDNNVASFRVADITKSGGGYRIYIKNQFKFTCKLEFDQDGNPSRMRSCRSPEDWTATPSKINLSCKVDKKRELCRGLYKLGSRGYSQRAHFQFFRILSRAEQEAIEAAPPDPAADPEAADPAAASTTPAKPAPPSHPLLGAWKCTFRSGKYSYKPMRCTVTRKSGGYYLKKHQGSQRIEGFLKERGKTLVFNGRFYCTNGGCKGAANGVFRKQGNAWVAVVKHDDPRGNMHETGVTLRR